MQIKSVKPKRKQFFFNSGKNLQKHYFRYTLDQHLWSKIGLRMCFWLMMVRLCWVEWVVGLDHHVHQAAKWQSQGHRQFKLHAHFLFPPPPSNQYGNGYKACNNYAVAMAWNKRDIVQEVVEENMASWKWKVRVTIWSLVPLLARLPIVGREFVRRGNKI